MQATNNFLSFIFRQRDNRLYFYSAIATGILLWLIFKSLYTNPHLIFDSYYYVQATVAHASVNAWPIGYSRFIQWMGLLSHSVNLLLATQYLLIQLSFLLFFYSLRYFFLLGKTGSLALFLFFYLNPIFLYLSNLVLSDILFTTLSLLWLTQLLWLLFAPRPYMLVTQAVLLLCAFSVRYNALYFPLIATLVFILSKQPVRYKIGGIALQLVLLGSFIAFTTHKMQTDYQVKQFSPFGGWKLANDALYMYEHVYMQNTEPVPQRFQALDTRVRRYFSRPHYPVSVLTNDATWGSFYMYIHPSPLIQYMFSIYGPDESNLNYKKFAPMGPLYQDYGAYLIKKYPFAFATHFVMPNIQRYFYPPQEVLVDPYNPFTLRKDYLGQPAIQWFHLITLSTPAQLVNLRSAIFLLYPAFTALVHFLFLLTGAAFLAFTVHRNQHKTTNYALLTIAALWLADFTFSILAAAIVLRYQVFIMITEMAFALVFIQALLQLQKSLAVPAAHPQKQAHPHPLQPV